MNLVHLNRNKGVVFGAGFGKDVSDQGCSAQLTSSVRPAHTLFSSLTIVLAHGWVFSCLSCCLSHGSGGTISAPSLASC